MTWGGLCQGECGISKNRADELIRIYDGRTTLAEVRENNRHPEPFLLLRREGAAIAALAAATIKPCTD
jgi:hypothetical protein